VAGAHARASSTHLRGLEVEQQGGARAVAGTQPRASSTHLCGLEVEQQGGARAVGHRMQRPAALPPRAARPPAAHKPAGDQAQAGLLRLAPAVGAHLRAWRARAFFFSTWMCYKGGREEMRKTWQQLCSTLPAQERNLGVHARALGVQALCSRLGGWRGGCGV